MDKDKALHMALEALEQHGTPFLHHEDAYSNSLNALRQAIADAEKQEPDDLTIAYMAGFYDGKNKDASQPKPEQELVAWRNAAIRVGEDLCSVGPFGYYDMTAKQWLDWALSVVTVHAPPPQRTWIGLTDEEITELHHEIKVRLMGTYKTEDIYRAIEAKLREKNGG